MKSYQKDLASIIKASNPKPKIQLSEQQIKALRSFGNVLLAILGVAGAITVAIAAPNALQAFGMFEKGRGRAWPKRDARLRKVTRSFYYLKEKGYVSLSPNGGDFRIQITDKGKTKLNELYFRSLTVPKQFWDGKYWEVAADIPTKQYRKAADALRRQLKRMNFYSLQRTLWFYPFDPRKQIDILSDTYRIGQFVTVMKISKMDSSDEKVLYNYFHEIDIL